MKDLKDILPKEDLFHTGHPLCPGCPGGMALRWITKVLGKYSIANIGATCLCLPTQVYPYSLEVPSLYIAMAPSPAGISGMSAAIKVLKRKGVIPADRKINVFAISGDGSTADIGMASLSGAAERNDDGLYFCYDNEAYMNTGISAVVRRHSFPGPPQPPKGSLRGKRIYRGSWRPMISLMWPLCP